MARLLDAWDAAKRAPEPVEVARRSVADVLLAGEEFRGARDEVLEGLALEEPSRRDFGKVASGVGAGLATAGLFVFPGGRSGQLALRGAGVAAGRGTKAAALRSAAGLGDEAFEGVAGGAGRNVLDALEQDLKAAGLNTPSRQRLVESFEPLGQMGREGGFTWNPRTGQNSFDSGYGVAVVKNYERPIPLDEFDSMKVFEYLRLVPEGESLSVAQRLAANPRNMVGAWVEPIDGVDHVFLDISTVLKDRSAALRIGGAQRELGVYDFANKSTISLSDTPEFLPGGSEFTPDALARYGFDSKDIPVGKWVDNPTAESIPLRSVTPFREQVRSGSRVDDLIPQIRERGFDDPLVLEVGMNGRATLVEGNHRLAAAERLGLERVPVRVVTARSVKEGAEVAVRDVGPGKLLKPSEVFSPEVPPTVSFPAEQRPGSGLILPRSSLRDAGGYDANIPGERVREMAEELVQRQLDTPVGSAALNPREIASVLQDLPEFSGFVRAYRDMVVGPMKDPLDRRKLRPGSLNEYARLAGLETPAWSSGVDVNKSFPAALKGTLPEALEAGAVNLGIRIRNMGTFATDDLLYPAYYLDFNKKLLQVSEQTGMPIEVLSSALASASSQAAPYDEVLRFASVARFVTVDAGRAKAVPGAYELLGNDSMAIATLRGLIDSINSPDFLTVKPFGHAMKTSPYAYGRIDPLYPAFYVADTVDALGQFLILGGKADTAKATASVVNQIAGRTLANVYGVPTAAAQEGFWGQIRVVRDGLKLAKSGKPTQVSLPAAFTGSKGPVEDILVNAVESMDPRVVALARSNRDKFYSEVKDGRVAAWNWDKAKSRPVISSVDYLVPSDQRLVAGGRGVALQRQMLELVESLGPALRSRLMAIAATSGISLSVLVRALGDATLAETDGYDA